MRRLLLFALILTASVAQAPAPAPPETPDAAPPVAQPKAPDVAPAATQIGQVVTVQLSGGAKVTGTLLRRNDQGVVLDLGHDAVTIPANRVLAIQKPDQAQARARKERGFFTLGRLPEAPVPELVKRFGDAAIIVKTPRGLGSGFVTSSQGHVITNYHVIEQSTQIVVTLFQRGEQGYEKRQFKRVKILATHPLRDIALLQIDPEEMKDVKVNHVVIAEEQDVRVGDMVFTIGNPLGLERTVTQGIVSSTSRTLGGLRFIQTDASINPGNSGGPLFNSRGEVVGIVCAGYVFFNGLAFGIPTSDLVSFLEHRDAFLYDESKPQNGVTYLPPPYREANDADAPEPAGKARTPDAKDPPADDPATQEEEKRPSAPLSD